MTRLDGKIALVTGGAQGIGAAIAEGLAADGATVVIADLNPPDGGIRADVADEADVQAMVDEVVTRHGRLDILINNAGLYASLAMRPFTEIPLEEWRQVMDVNVASMFLTCRAAVPVMRAQGGGKIVNISSGTPFRGVPFLLHYVTSKGAIVALTRALAKELGQGLDPRELRCARVHDERRRRGAPRGGREAARRLGREPDDPARPGAGGRRRRGRLPLHAGRRLRHGADDGDRRRAVLPLILALSRRPHDAQNAVVHELDNGTTLVWELLDAGPDDALLAAPVDVRPGWVMRHDRIDFPPGGIAYRHTHPGPGIRYLLSGSIRIDSGGEVHDYGPDDPWFESGPEPVLATASTTEESAFVRVLLLPGEWAGKRTITYVDPADEDRPKLQRPTVYGEYPIAF